MLWQQLLFTSYCNTDFVSQTTWIGANVHNEGIHVQTEIQLKLKFFQQHKIYNNTQCKEILIINIANCFNINLVIQLCCGTCKKAKHLGLAFGKLNLCQISNKSLNFLTAK